MCSFVCIYSAAAYPCQYFSSKKQQQRRDFLTLNKLFYKPGHLFALIQGVILHSNTSFREGTSLQMEEVVQAIKAEHTRSISSVFSWRSAFSGAIGTRTEVCFGIG